MSNPKVVSLQSGRKPSSALPPIVGSVRQQARKQLLTLVKDLLNGTDDAELFLTASDPDLLLKQVSRLVETKGAGRKQNTVPREGTNPRPADDKDAAARAFFGIT